MILREPSPLRYGNGLRPAVLMATGGPGGPGYPWGAPMQYHTIPSKALPWTLGGCRLSHVGRWVGHHLRLPLFVAQCRLVEIQLVDYSPQLRRCSLSPVVGNFFTHIFKMEIFSVTLAFMFSMFRLTLIYFTRSN